MRSREYAHLLLEFINLLLQETPLFTFCHWVQMYLGNSGCSSVQLKEVQESKIFYQSLLSPRDTHLEVWVKIWAPKCKRDMDVLR